MRARRATSCLIVAFVAVAFVVVVAACGGTEEEPPRTVSVFGPWLGEPADRLADVFRPFEEATGIDVQYTGSSSFGRDIQEQIQEGNAPDLAIFSQPALLEQLAIDGEIQPLPATIASQVRKEAPGDVLAAVDDGQGNLVGVPFRSHLKSLVWYSPSQFKKRGYRAPTTWVEFGTLANRMRSDGLTPWCVGFRAVGSSNGWPGTDWIEDLVLRLHGGAVYDAWVSGNIPFDDPRIEEAFTVFEEQVLRPGQTLGGRRAILSTDWRVAGDPLLQDKPECMLHRNASFYEENLPSGVEIGPDGDLDVFILPPINPAVGKTVIISGEQVAALNLRPETEQLLAFLATPEAGGPWAAQSGFISPYMDGPREFGREFERRVSDEIRSADIIRFDGSDLMTPSVGSGSFYDAILGFVRNRDFIDAAAVAEDGRPYTLSVEP